VISVWPIIGTGPNELAYQDVKLAMAHRGGKPYWRLDRIAMRDWQRLAEQTGVPGAFAEMVTMVERVEDALEVVRSALPSSFPEQVWTRIRDGTMAQCRRFLGGRLQQ